MTLLEQSINVILDGIRATLPPEDKQEEKILEKEV